MALFKGFNLNLIYFIFGLLVGFCFSYLVRISYAAEIDKNNFDNGIFEALDEVYAPNSVIIYDPDSDIYYLSTFTNEAKFGFYQDKKTLFFNEPAWETGSYYYDSVSKKWVSNANNISQYTFTSDNSYIVYSSKNINYKDLDSVYFYKTSTTITNKYYHSINTVLMQKLPQTLKILVPIGLIIMALFIGVGLIPRIIYKFM